MTKYIAQRQRHAKGLPRNHEVLTVAAGPPCLVLQEALIGVSSLWGLMGTSVRVLSTLAEFEGRSFVHDNPYFLPG